MTNMDKARWNRAISLSPGISSCWRTTSSTASAAWAKACRCRSRTDGRRIMWLAHESAPKNFTGVDVTDPRKPKVVVQTDLPQAAHALELAGDVRQHHGGGLPDPEDGPEAGRHRTVRHLHAGEAEVDLVLRLLGPAFARRASAVVLRRRIRAHGLRRARLRADASATTTSSTAASTCAIRRSRPKSAAGGMPGTQRGRQCRRRRRGTRSTRATARTTPTSIRSGRTAATSAISTAACSSSTSRTSRTRSSISPLDNSPPYTGFMHTVRAAVRPRADARDRRVDREQRAGLAETDLGTRRARRDESRADLDLPAAPTTPSMAAAGRFGAHNIHENVPLPTCWQSDQIVLGTFFNGGLRAYDISNPFQPKEVGIFVPPAPNDAPTGDDPDQRRVRRRARDRLHASTGSPAGSTSWRWISDGSASRPFPVALRRDRSGAGSSASAERGCRSRSSRVFSARARRLWSGAFSRRRKAKARPSSSTNSAPQASTTRCCAERRRDCLAGQRLRVLRHPHRPADRAPHARRSSASRARCRRSAAS